MAEYKIPAMDIQLFADGGAAADGEGGSAFAGTGVTAADAARQTTGEETPRENKDRKAQTVFPANARDAAAQEHGDPKAAADRKAAFEAFKKDFKAELDAEKQQLVQARVKGMKETVEKYEALAPVLQMLGAKYGADPTNAEALVKAIEDDDSYYEQEALQKGMSVENLKAAKKIERENAALRRQLADFSRRQQIEQDVAKWARQAEEAAAVFPDLDLGEELNNPQFFGLLKDGIDVQTAYFAVHHREIIPKVQQYTARKTREQVTESIRAGQNRPAENGTQNHAAAVYKSDVAALTKADRDAIIRRVQRGERITF